jgi:hypothetical protein
MELAIPLLAWGVLKLPEWVLHSDWFSVLAAFVAINTVMYTALAIAKVLPKIYVADWFTSRDRRGQNRSIFPSHAS